MKRPTDVSSSMAKRSTEVSTLHALINLGIPFETLNTETFLWALRQFGKASFKPEHFLDSSGIEQLLADYEQSILNFVAKKCVSVGVMGQGSSRPSDAPSFVALFLIVDNISMFWCLKKWDADPNHSDGDHSDMLKWIADKLEVLTRVTQIIAWLHDGSETGQLVANHFRSFWYISFLSLPLCQNLMLLSALAGSSYIQSSLAFASQVIRLFQQHCYLRERLAEVQGEGSLWTPAEMHWKAVFVCCRRLAAFEGALHQTLEAAHAKASSDSHSQAVSQLAALMKDKDAWIRLSHTVGILADFNEVDEFARARKHSLVEVLLKWRDLLEKLRGKSIKVAPKKDGEESSGMLFYLAGTSRLQNVRRPAVVSAPPCPTIQSAQGAPGEEDAFAARHELYSHLNKMERLCTECEIFDLVLLCDIRVRKAPAVQSLLAASYDWKTWLLYYALTIADSLLLPRVTDTKDAWCSNSLDTLHIVAEFTMLLLSPERIQPDLCDLLAEESSLGAAFDVLIQTDCWLALGLDEFAWQRVLVPWIRLLSSIPAALDHNPVAAGVDFRATISSNIISLSSPSLNAMLLRHLSLPGIPHGESVHAKQFEPALSSKFLQSLSNDCGVVEVGGASQLMCHMELLDASNHRDLQQCVDAVESNPSKKHIEEHFALLKNVITMPLREGSLHSENENAEKESYIM